MVREIGGVSIGQAYDSSVAVVDAFANKGVKVSLRYISELRAGLGSGVVIEENRVACALLLNDGSSLKKDGLYDKIAKTATAPGFRLPQVRFPNRYNSNGFISRVSDDLGIQVRSLDEMLRAMRVEAVMSFQNGLMPNNLMESFNNNVNQFLKKREDPHTRHNSPSLQRLFVMRGETKFNPENFYGSIYEQTSKKFIGSWTIEEVDWFDQFYAFRLQSPNQFSPLDVEVLRETALGNQGSLPGKLTKQTGILVNRRVIETHTRVLLGQLQSIG